MAKVKNVFEKDPGGLLKVHADAKQNFDQELANVIFAFNFI